MMESINIDVAGDPVIAGVVANIDTIRQTTPALVITDENAKEASDNLHSVKTAIKRINSQRLEITRPIDDAKKTIMARTREVIAPLEQVKAELESKLLVYQVEKKRQEEEHQRFLREQEKERLAAEQKELEEQADINQSDYALEEAIVVENKIDVLEKKEIKSTGKVQSNFTTSSLSYKWVFSLEDFSKVPDEYKMLDSVKIRKMIAGVNGTHDIPGLKITKEPILNTRRR